jgi:DNA-binding IclR family transcriptional regulator
MSFLTGMPRATVRRKVEYLMQKGYVTRIGTRYVISEATLRETTTALDRAIDLVCEAGAALRSVQNGQLSSEKRPKRTISSWHSQR